MKVLLFAGRAAFSLGMFGGLFQPDRPWIILAALGALTIATHRAWQSVMPVAVDIIRCGGVYLGVNPWPKVALADGLVFDGRTVRREGSMVVFSLDNGSAAYVLRDTGVPAAGPMDLQHGSQYSPSRLFPPTTQRKGVAA